MLADSPAFSAAAREQCPRRLARERPTARVEQQPRRPPTGSREPGPHSDQVCLDRSGGIRAEWDASLLAALARQQHRASVQVEIVDVEADRLRDPRTGAVEQLDQRAVAHRQRRLVDSRRIDQPLDLVDG